MKALILAGGQATRLRPITHDTPKCLLKIGNQTILDFQLNTLRDNHITDIVIVTGFKAKLLESHIKSHHPDLHIEFIFNDKYETTRAGYGIWMARNALTEDILYLNSDLLCDPIIIKKIITNPHPSVTAIQRNPWDEEEVNVRINNELEIIEIGKLIPEHVSYGEFIGATKLSLNFVTEMIKILNQYVNLEDNQHFAVDIINQVIKNKVDKLYSLDVSDHMAIEIDTIDDFEQGKRLWSKL